MSLGQQCILVFVLSRYIEMVLVIEIMTYRIVDYDYEHRYQAVSQFLTQRICTVLNVEYRTPNNE